jgi:hypothetical protein
MEHTESKREPVKTEVKEDKVVTKETPKQHCYFDDPEIPVPLGQGSETNYIEVATKGATKSETPTRPVPREPIRKDDELTAAEKAKVIQDEKDAEERLKKATAAKGGPHAK